MQIQVISKDKSQKQFEIAFVHGEKSLLRPVNYCTKANGHFDPAATMARIAQVANGVARKMEKGIL